MKIGSLKIQIDIKAPYFSEIIWVYYTYMRYIHFRKLYIHMCEFKNITLY